MLFRIFAAVGMITLATSTHTAEAQTKNKIRYCQGSRFKPCVCAPNVTKDVAYLPSMRACRNNAAIITKGRYLNVFSAVVRDNSNRDRVPLPGSGFGGCSYALANSVSPPNSCSAYKSQKVFYTELNNFPVRVHCLGAKGSSSIFKRVARITVKIVDSPNDSNDSIARLCLAGPTKALNYPLKRS